MKSKKTTVNISYENLLKIQQLQRDTGLTQSEIINQAISDTPIIILGKQKNLAQCFFDSKKQLANTKTIDVKKEVDETCQCLNSLMQKLEEMMLSKKA